MTFDANALYELLPAIYRIRDAEEGEPLRQLLAVIAEQAAVIEEDLQQLYDDQFIETCADWVTPYIGDLIGFRSLRGEVPSISSPRADVANTIARRRRKGTAAMLEQLARDVTGWPARAVEFFQLLTTTQYMNHIRAGNRLTPDMRDWESLERLGTAFDSVAHTLDVRSIASRRGRYNIPNIGLFLWRLRAFSLRQSPAAPVDAHRFRFSPLGNDAPLFTNDESETDITHLAEPINVPAPISRRVMDEHLGDYYGEGKSLQLEVDGNALPKGAVQVCNLSSTDEDDAAGWIHNPSDGKVAIDPVLGRIAFPPSETPPETVRVTFHYGFSGELGGGEYDRGNTLGALDQAQEFFIVSQTPDPEATHSTIQDALDDHTADAIIEIIDNGRYEENLEIQLEPGAHLELRAKNGCRPTILLAPSLNIQGGPGSTVTLNGLLFAAAQQEDQPPSLNALVQVSDVAGNALQELHLRHCTIVPGQALSPDGQPQRPGAPSVEVSLADAELAVEHSIVGGLRVHPASKTSVVESIIDATDATHVAFAGPVENPLGAGGQLVLDDCTVIGKVNSVLLERVSNSILHGRTLDDSPPVRAERRQEGCLRFSFVPNGSIGPRRYRCQPDLAIAAAMDLIAQGGGKKNDEASSAVIIDQVTAMMVPEFTSTSYGHPGYAQLRQSCPLPIRTGAEDETEMGLFRKLYAPQRETNLRVRLEEYLRFGLEAGIFYET